MPHHFPFASSHPPDEDMQELEHASHEVGIKKRHNSVLDKFHRVGNWLKRTEEDTFVLEQLHEANDRRDGAVQPEDLSSAPAPPRRPSLLGRRLSRRVVPELPRPLTFRRQQSEKRDRLLPVEPERRAVSADRRPIGESLQWRASPPLTSPPSMSGPEVGTPDEFPPQCFPSDYAIGLEAPPPIEPLPEILPTGDNLELVDDRLCKDGQDERELQAELEAKWILNLVMLYRDGSNREKFFVTYAQEPNHWRRLTVSIDYRNAVEGLEADLETLRNQRDKSSRIYDAIRDSLPEIQFFDTSTNLKLETQEGQLHVHVTEDVNEVIHYPSTSLVRHLDCVRYRESEIDFEAHLSGFVYRVKAVGSDERILIKKEIPSPDTVEEFLYEINALDSLRGARNVIQLQGLVTDEEGDLIKGLLISVASQGSLVDILYDYGKTDALPWIRRAKWAYQIIQGLSEIHEAGFVQGDFTLSNIVIDEHDNAKIIDINRRGCPLGWEPPEFVPLIQSGQKISMCIGVKSDLYQLGMVLWGLAEEIDEPERHDRINGRLPPVTGADAWFDRIIDICLSNRPKDRLNAKHLLRLFPPDFVPDPETEGGALKDSQHSVSSHRSDKEFIDPATAVDLGDIDEFRRRQATNSTSHPTSGNFTFADHPPSTDYRYDSTGSYIIAERDQSPEMYRRRRSSPFRRPISSTTTVSSRPDEFGEERCRSKRVYMDDSSVDYRLDSDQTSTPIEHPDRTLPHDVSRFMPPPLSPLQSASMTTAHQLHGSRDGKALHTISDLTSSEFTHLSGPVHQDSGFDELMIASLEELPPQQSYPQRSHDKDKTHMALLTSPTDLSPLDEVPTPQSAHELLTPLTYHTPLTSPIEGYIPLLSVEPQLHQTVPDVAKPDSIPASERINSQHNTTR